MKATIIGGGIIGLSAAYYLSEDGWDVTLLERGDGTDNCSPDTATDAERDALVALDTTINGLPIIERAGEVVGAGAYRAPGNAFEALPPPRNDEALTLDLWYGRHVIGGAGAFVLPAHGYNDFGRAMRQKFVTEISAVGSRQ